MQHLFRAHSSWLPVSAGGFVLVTLLVLFALTAPDALVAAQQSTLTPLPTPTLFRAAINSPIEVTHVGQLQEIRSLKVFEEGDVAGLAFRPGESNLIASGLGTSGTIAISIKLVNAETGEVSPDFFKGERRSGLMHMALSPDGEIVAGTSSDAGLSLWNARTGDFINRLTWSAQPVSMDFTPDSQQLVSPGNGITFRTLQPDGATREVGDSSLLAASVKLSPDGSRVALFDIGGNVYVYNVASGEEEFSIVPEAPFKYGVYWSGEYGTVNPSYVLDFSPDGHKLAFVMDKYIALWDVEQRKLITNIDTGSQPFSLKFSPLGDLLASGDDRGYLHIWDTSTGNSVYSERSYPKDKEGRVTALAFNSDATMLVTGGYGENPKTNETGAFLSVWQIR